MLADYLVKHGLKRSAQREAILEAFLKAGHHVSVEDLLKIVRRREPEVGRTTIYRTLKLFQEAGLASELLFGARRASSRCGTATTTTTSCASPAARSSSSRAPRSRGCRTRSPPRSAS